MAVGEQHEEFFYATNTLDEVLWAIHEHTKVAAANGQMRIVNDGAQDAIYCDIGGGLGFNVPTAASHFVAGSFIVVEPVEEYPGGGRWQFMLVRTATIELAYILAPDGGWDSTDVTAGNNYGFGDGLPGSNVITDLVPVRDAQLSASGSLRLSSCNLDTYDSGTKRYTYFRIFMKPSGTGDSDFGLRVGGFIPTDIVNETKPIVILAETSNLNTAARYWGSTWNDGSNNVSRTPYEYPPRTRQMNDLGTQESRNSTYCRATGFWNLGSYGLDRSGQLVALSIRLVSESDAKTLGNFGPNDMKVVSDLYTNYDTDGGAPPSYFNYDTLLLRWKP